MKQYEDRKKVVAAIYLNTMSNKVSSVENRERQRRRQSEPGGGAMNNQTSGGVKSG